MADIIIIAVLAVAVFYIVRSQLYKLRQGQCGGQCPGCRGGYTGCQGCDEPPEAVWEVRAEDPPEENT